MNYWRLVSFMILSCGNLTSEAFNLNSSMVRKSRLLKMCMNDGNEECFIKNAMAVNSRRYFIQSSGAGFIASLIAANPNEAEAAFTPGGTLVEFEVGPTVGNAEASSSRKADNSNVLFNQDNYFKFGTAAPWIEPDSTEFPVKMPFTLSQQRYDGLKKYGTRVNAGAQFINNLGEAIRSVTDGNFKDVIPDPLSAPEYALRPMGLLANSFLASENTGTTNELLLARWYINEMLLQVGDIKAAKSEQDALKSYSAAKKAVNSYFAMLNRVITPKVGDKFPYLQV
mmetsp:Transcript_7284/g.10430  ORF Transcript_7284/g.10430 Transcript_7284/m.10430 type:complete len:283 (+) Transcript_7284:90-938(+)